MKRPAAPEDQIPALCARYDLPADAAVGLTGLFQLLVGDPRAPTGVRDPKAVLEDHLADSLVALELQQVVRARVVADLGAGAGIPGLPLAIAIPDARFSLVESAGRKCEFIARAIEVCGVTNAHAVHDRAESWAGGRERCDLVTARALGPLPIVAEYAAPLLALGGALLVWRGRRDAVDEQAGAAAAAQLGLEPLEPRRVQPYPGAVHRHLQLMVKTAPTPAGFPRRPGMARKRPLGGDRDVSDRGRR